MNTHVTVAEAGPDAGTIMENVLVKGDLERLTSEERADYYMAVCKSVGLNPLTKPFDYIKLNGKLQLYALRSCTDQLRSIHKVSVEELAEKEIDGVYIVTAKVRNAEGRTDMAKGALALGDLRGEARANAIMKCETKAKRRATLSICGLGILDETEADSVPGAQFGEPKHAESKPAAIEQKTAIAEAAVAPEYVAPMLLPAPDSKEGVLKWAQDFLAGAGSSKTHVELIQWARLNGDTISMLKEKAPKLAGRIDAEINRISETLPPLVEQKLGDTVKAAAAIDAKADTILPPKESTALMKMLVRSLGECTSDAAVDKWKADKAAALATLQEYDREAAATHEEERRAALAEAVAA